MISAVRLLAGAVLVSALAGGGGCWTSTPKDESKDEAKLDKHDKADKHGQADSLEKADIPVAKDGQNLRPEPSRRKPKDPEATADTADVRPPAPRPEDLMARLAQVRKHMDVVDDRRRAIDEYVRARNSKDLLPALVDIQERLSQVQGVASGNSTLDTRITEMLREVFGMISLVKAGDWAKAEERAESIHAYGSACNKLLGDTIAHLKIEGDSTGRQ